MPSDQTKNYQKRKAEDEQKVQQQFLKGIKDEDLGVFCDLFSAKTKIGGQDGGVVSALLIKGFREGLFDAAIVVRRMEGYTAEAAVAENTEDVLAAKGTQYLRVNVTKKLRELTAEGKKRIAIVCTPCEAAAARRIQQTVGRDCEVTIIGLFCFEAFNPEKLKEEMKNRLGVDLDKVARMQVRRGKFAAQVEGKEVSCRVKDLDAASEKACKLCDDFVSRLADVSVGSVGSKPGYSTVVVRSSIGEKLVRNLEATKGTFDKQEIAKISKFKRERSKKSLSNLNKS
jgi:coenzyme F420-reducing hydrogenase beta subunit